MSLKDHPRVKDLTGKRIGHLEVLRFLHVSDQQLAVWEAKCDCGAIVQRSSGALGKSMKCGTAYCGVRCPLFKPGVVTHGLSGSPEYNAHRRMLQRCYNPKNPSYERYGARGITVCKRWRDSFLNFYKDMGPMPHPKMSPDRIENSKGYSPENCRWATPKEQANNREDNVMLDTPWGKMTLSQAAEKAGLNPDVVSQRRRKGYSGGLLDPVRPRDKPMQTKWGLLTIKEACKRAGISPKVAWCRMERGFTDPDEIFSKEDFRITKRGKP